MKKIIFIFIFFISTINSRSQGIIEKEITDWEFRMVGDSVWKPAKVPGTIIDNFVDLSDISNPLHPYYGDNEKLYQWIGEKDWEFRTTIIIDPDLMNKGYDYSIDLGSLDLFADIYVNGSPWMEYDSLQNRSAFFPESISSYDQVLEIKIVFHSTTNVSKERMLKDLLKIPGGERVYARTAQYQFGWDWAPRFVNMGIRKPVLLTMFPPRMVYLNGIHFDKWKRGNKQMLTLSLDGSSSCDSLGWHFKVFLNGDSIDGYDIPLWHGNVGNIPIYLMENPKFWWPNGSGNASNYYEFDLRLTLPGDTQTLAHYHTYYAYCNIELIQKKDKVGESFYFKVNDKKIFAKGANYVPDDSFHPGKNSVELVNLAAEANMNMLRIWGGGTYPEDDFYIQCMKKGIMIWQDMMFACAMYPGNDAFKWNVLEEIDYQKDRLNNYNHIALWCGNNENDEGWKNWGWQKELKMSSKDSTKIWNNYINLFQVELKNEIRLYDTITPYIPTSPKHGWGRKESMTEGDSHYWGVWWGLEPLEKYNEKVPRFMSEFGMQGMPELSTLKKVIPDSAMNFDSPKFKNHQKHPTGFKTLDHYLKEYLVIPHNIEDYAYATQILQAYALTIAIEAQRRAMPYCMGSLIWQLNDCWPVTSWSLIDSELKNKIAYWEVKKSFEPVHISVKEEDKEILIIVVNEMSKNTKGPIKMEINDFYGKILWIKQMNATASAGKTSIIYRLPKKILKAFDLNQIYFRATMKYDKEEIETFYHFVKPGQLKLPPAEFTVSVSDRYNSISVKSNVYAPFSKAEGFYFGHLEPGKEKNYWIYEDDKADIILFDPGKVKCLNQLLN